jgi:peptide/nickel transport system ATP-binding protein
VGAPAGDATGPLLEVTGLKKHFPIKRGLLSRVVGHVKAVDGVSLELARGRTLALVGESGCGKTTAGKAILQLIRPTDGRVQLDGKELTGLSRAALRPLRRRMQMIFQEPMTSLNPVYTCGEQIIEALVLHEKLDRKAARARTIEMLKLVGIPAPEQRVDAYPHQMSGGMRQRVMIAMALACQPAILIADEPTTALDVTIQAQILELLKHLQGMFGMAVLLITHDLGVVAETADRVAVMYAGQVVEYCDVQAAFKRTLHPYTAGLLHALPRLGEKRDALRVIPGNVPDPLRFPSGCRFHPRCPVAQERCRESEPPVLTFDGEHQARCWRADEIAAGVLDPAGEGAARD